MDDTLTLARKEILQNELARYLKILTYNDGPELIMVFGSLATGEIHLWSDIDLLIVQPTSLPFYQRLHEFRRLLKPQVATDILVYTPEEFDQLRRERPFFREEILTKGKIMYERKC